MLTRHRLLITTALALFTGTAALAEDPPLRVGRISYTEGPVSFHATDDNDWSAAALNYPLVVGNALWTDPEARSEVQIGGVDVRMDHSTEMEIMQLDGTATRINVPQGVVSIQFAALPVNGNVEVMTPSGNIELTHPGTYHIDAGQPVAGAPAPQVQVSALEGQLEVRTPRAVLQVMQGETATLSGNPPAFALSEAASTSFDDWALAREHRQQVHEASLYVSPHMTGYEDLDYYGQWANDPNYGRVWYPTAIDNGWAPYRNGHWSYIAPWGWTWVDDAPWGFAPFHYGRWASIGDRWCWVPGEVVAQPVYAPALVAFVGGAGWSVALSEGSTPALGWLPLAPREVFYPYYPASVNYVRNVNITNINRREINTIGINRTDHGNWDHYANHRAATVVPQDAFRRGGEMHRAQLNVPHEQLQHVPLMPQFPQHDFGKPHDDHPRVLTTQPPVQPLREEHAHEARPADAQPPRLLYEQTHIPQPQQNVHQDAPQVTRLIQHDNTPQEVRPHGYEPQPIEQHPPVQLEQHVPQVTRLIQRDNTSQDTRSHGYEPQHEMHESREVHVITQPQQPVHEEHEHHEHVMNPPPYRRENEMQQRAAMPVTPSHEAIPQAQVPHPHQERPIAATPQGWQRMEQQHLQPAQPQQQQQHSPHEGGHRADDHH